MRFRLGRSCSTARSRSTTSGSAPGSIWLPESDPAAVASPSVLRAFDLLYLDRRDLAQVVGNGYEGLVAKDEVSAYVGGPTRRWLKVK